MATKYTSVVTKCVEMGHGDGTTTREDFVKQDFAHAPTDDPATWRLPLREYAEDAMPSADCLLHAVEAIKRAEYAPQQTRLDRTELPYARYRVAQAWQEVFGSKRPLPDALLDAMPPEEE